MSFNTDSRSCPKCKSNMIAGRVPSDLIPLYGRGYFTRVITCYNMNRDKIMGYKCPDCGYYCKKPQQKLTAKQLREQVLDDKDLCPNG